MRSFAPQMFLAICTLAAAGASQVIFVDQDALGANDGSSWQDAYVDLGDGLAAAAPGSQVWAAEGLYLPPPANMVDPRSASFVLASGVELYGGFDGSEASVNARDIAAHPTVLSGDLGTPGDASDNAYHVLRAELGAARLDGLVLRDGRADGAAFDDKFGALLLSADFNSALIVSACRFEGGHATQSGGAVYAEKGSELFVACHFESNEANAGGAVGLGLPEDVRFRGCSFTSNTGIGSAPVGGAISAGGFGQNVSVEIEDCDFLQNTSGQGGAISVNGGLSFNSSALTVRRSSFASNTAIHGGALSIRLMDSAVLDACDFVDNSVSNVGGAVVLWNTDARVARSRFLGNSTPHLGGALAASDGGTLLANGSAPTITDTLFVGNSADRGGALFVHGGDGVFTQLVGCSFAANSASDAGGGVQIEELIGGAATGVPLVRVSNSVLWGNSDALGNAESAQLNLAGGVLVLNHSLVQGLSGTHGGVGNLGADPLFVDLDGADDLLGTLDDDARLAAGSPAIDAGDGALLLPDELDADCDNDLAEAQPLDLASLLRAFDDPASPDTGAGGAPVVDMGAHEFGSSLPIDVWTDLGGGSLGSNGVPVLELSGTLCAQQIAAAKLTQAPSSATALLWISNGSGGFAKFGGTLHAFPYAAQIIVPTSPAGTVSGQTAWPSEVPPGLSFVFQFLVIDPGFGITLSNAVEGITP